MACAAAPGIVGLPGCLRQPVAVVLGKAACCALCALLCFSPKRLRHHSTLTIAWRSRNSFPGTFSQHSPPSKPSC